MGWCCIVSWDGVVLFHGVVLGCFRALMFLANCFGGVVQDMELLHGVVYCFIGWCCIVSQGVVLFHGVVLGCFRALMFLANCFGGVVQDLDPLVLHGVLYCFTGCCIVSWGGVGVFQSADVPGQLLWGCGSGHGAVTWGVVLFHRMVLYCFMGWCWDVSER